MRPVAARWRSGAPTLDVAAVDAFVRNDAPDDVDPVDKGAFGTTHAIHAVRLGVDARLARDASGQKAGVAARRAEADDVALEYGDPQARVAFGEAVGGP